MAFVFTPLLVCTCFVLCIRETSACSSKNTTCSENKTIAGYEFEHGCPEGSKIYIYDNNKTVLAIFSRSSEHTAEVLEIDKHSFTTKSCQEFRVQCVYTPHENNHTGETCMVINIIESSAGPSIDQTNYWAIIPACVLPLLCFIGFLGYVAWTKKFRGDLRCDENENDHNNTLETVSVRSPPDISSPSQRTATDSFRNLSDDPGGINGSQIIANMSEMDVACAVGGQKAGEHETEGQPLLSDQRAANRRVDMTGEALALVGKRGFDPDQASTRPVAPVHDVES